MAILSESCTAQVPLWDGVDEARKLFLDLSDASALSSIVIMRLKMQSNIRAKPELPKLLRRISFLDTLFTQTAQGIYPFILVPQHIYKDLQSPAPNPYYLALVVHEQTHLDRQSKYGWIKWMVSYAVSSRFRFKEEIEAIRAQMAFLKKEGLSYPIEATAKLLSSWLYLKPVTYETALKELNLAWEEA